MKNKGLLLGMSIFLFLFLAGSVAFRIHTNRPPVMLVNEAGKQLAEAQRQASIASTGDVFLEAARYYDSAMTEWETQNERMILVRDYSLVATWAEKSLESSRNTIASSRKSHAVTRDILENRIASLGSGLHEFERVFGNFPMSVEHREVLAHCKLGYAEGRQALKNNNHAMCRLKLDQVEADLEELRDHYTKQLTGYFNDFGKWDEMARQTIADSKKKQAVAVVVDKYSRELSLYMNGICYHKYPVELGTNWVGNKVQQGDKSTPEGRYRIIEKKQHAQTKYHRALLLDYPNQADLKRFSSNKKNGVIDQGARIGNLIEIHGNGGKGVDWTDGCIALTNTDMDNIYKLCPVGTMVTIVGSTKPLSEFISGIK